MTKLFLSIALMLNLLTISLSAQPCEITAVTAVALPCQGNYFSVSVDLDVNNPSSPGFTLAGNGVIYGTYLYSDLPVSVGPFLGDDESVYEFIAWDVENADCQSFTTLPALNCGPICSISNFVLDFVTCVGNQSAIVVFDFDYQNPSGLTFDLFNEAGEDLGTWLYSSLPVTEPFFVVNGAAPIVLTVCDHTNTDCCQTFTLDAIDCNPNNCEIFSVELDPDCTGSNFLVHLDFGYDNPASDSFTVNGNNLSYGTFAYDSLPITLGPLNGNTNINWEFHIADVGNPSCNTTEILGIYHCPPPCDVRALDALALECNGNEAYSLLIGLDIEGEGDNGFAVFSENSYYGSYMYNQLPLTIPAFEGSGEFVDVVSVCDNENLGCCSTTPFEALLCAGCIIYNLTAVPLPCNMDDEIFVQIDFSHQNNSTEGFEVTGNGNNYGEFSYDDLPIQVGPFVGDGSQYFEFVVTDLVNPLCFDAVELGFINCDTICEISNLAVETGACTGNNMYVLHVDFDYQGVSGAGFDVYANGELFGFYSYNDLPLTIEEFASNGTGTDTIKVCENDNLLCCASLAFAAPVCPCNIYDVNAVNLGCSSDSTFAISLEFFYENLSGDSVDVFIDGVLTGTYSINNIPIILDIPEGDGTGVIAVCASDLGNCCDEVVIELMMCETPQCNIFDLIAETGDCNSDSTFLLDIVFGHVNLAVDSITVSANGNFIGQYIIDPVFNRIEQFPVQSADTTTITVCAVGAPDCCDTYSFVTPDCSLFGQCHIWDLVVETDECTSDSTYILHLNFNSQNLPVDSVILTGNGDFIGQYAVTTENILIENFPVFTNMITTLIVCAVGETDCCDTIDFETPDCSQFGLCNIWDLEGQVGDCASDSTFSLHIEFHSLNLSSDSVIVTGNGNYIGTFLSTNDTFTITDFPVFGTMNTLLTLCSLESPDCCDTFEFETPDCTGGGICNLFDLVADFGTCQSDSTYSLFLQYQTLNLQADSVSVMANNELIGHFLHNPNGFTIDNFPVFDAIETVVTVCALGNNDCCDFVEFPTPDCEGSQTCQLFDLIADAGGCNGDSTYTLFIHYFANNLPGDSVNVSTDAGYSAHFAHNPDGITIPDFPAYNLSHTTISVCALGSGDCCDTYTFETPDCGQGFDCEIYNLFAETGQCTSDSTFVLDVVFEGYNLPADSVFIFANSAYIGTYLNDPAFIHIENFPQLPGQQTTLTVCAVNAMDCCASYTFETPSCSGECSIFDIAVDVQGCNSDSTFTVVVNFQYENIPGGGFDLYAGDVDLGFFNFDQVPALVTGYPSNATGQYLVTVCESDGTECCTSFEFTGPVCGSGQCSIYNLEYVITECDSAGNFYFILDFDFANTGLDGFDVVGNGNNYGNFSYDSLPIQIGPFPTGDTAYEFLVYDDAFNECFAVITPGVVDCFVSATPVDYDDFFTLFNNGTVPGIYARKDINLSLYNANGKNVLYQFPLSADEIYELKTQPAGLYIATITYGANTWPVKLVKAGN